MSVKLMGAIWEHGPDDSTQRFVLLTLANYANDAGAGAYPSFATIAKRCAISRRTAIRAVDALIEDGYLVRRRRKADGKFTSSEYKINPQKLVSSSDTVSPQEAISGDTMTPGSDTVSPGWCQDDTTVVTPRHQGSDTVSPNPLSDPLSDPLEEGEGSRTTTPPKKSPPPPKVQSHIPDRTPAGFQASSGYRPPPEPEPVQQDAATAQAVGHIANAITDVTGVSAKLNRDEVYNFACDLHEAGYTAEQIRDHYGQSKVAERWHWYESDWRGKKGDRPRLKEIRETIAGAVAWRPADQLKQENGGQSWVERSIELARRNGLLPQPQTG